jgi:phosphoadenosine phosphosulfate reductase
MHENLKLNELSNILSGKTIEESMRILTSTWPLGVIFTTSFGIEDQVLTHIIFKYDIPVEVITLDTGRLFPETYKVFHETQLRYNKRIRVFFPGNDAVEEMVTTKGPFSFYESKDNRLECCRIRKVIPLGRALAGKKCWISGIRAAQSENRAGMTNLEYDEDKNLFKFYPLFDWSLEDVEKYINENNVPYNVLHDKGYVSIGCEPCTRAISKGQDFRAGRWWWETEGPKECGCHLK